MTFTIKIAGVPIKVEHRYCFIRRICEDYLTDDAPAFGVSVSDEQIDSETKMTGGRFTRELCESTCLHREIVQKLVKYGIILMHSAVISVDGSAYVFMAKSGIGKSTHVRLWLETFGDRAFVVNGDKPMFSFEDGVFMVHGSPWRGKEGMGRPVSVPVRGICFIERGEVNHIEKEDSPFVAERIFHQVLLPVNAEDSILFMKMMDRILKEVPFYRLICNMNRESALVAYEGMNKQL